MVEDISSAIITTDEKFFFSNEIEGMNSIFISFYIAIIFHTKKVIT
jgi:hypothetical protein